MSAIPSPAPPLLSHPVMEKVISRPKRRERHPAALGVNCFAIISLLIASLGRHESGGSLGVAASATFTHWPAFGRRSLPLFRLFLACSRLVPLLHLPCLSSSNLSLLPARLGSTGTLHPPPPSPLLPPPLFSCGCCGL